MGVPDFEVGGALASLSSSSAISSQDKSPCVAGFKKGFVTFFSFSPCFSGVGLDWRVLVTSQ